MTSPSLVLGSALLAFSPSASLLLLLVSQKPQLVILAVCSAFAYLLSALLSSLFWLVITSIDGAIHGGDGGIGAGASGVGTLLALAVPGVFSQMLVRCYFVRGYFRVESVIRRSVAKHEEETTAAAAAATSRGSSNGSANNGAHDEDAHAETNALQLQLNDKSCSIASGCGYALLHSLFLYGTLLASESGEANSYDEGVYAGGGGSTGHGGTLYQESCGEFVAFHFCASCALSYDCKVGMTDEINLSANELGGMPSLINGALIACMFSVLDVMWMMLCFFGMRRRSSSRGGIDAAATSVSVGDRGGGTAQALVQALTCQGISDSRSGGIASLLFVAITHLTASLVLAPNGHGADGCRVSLPLLGVVVIWVGIVLSRVVGSGKFLPEDQRRRIQGMVLGLRTVEQSHHVE